MIKLFKRFIFVVLFNLICCMAFLLYFSVKVINPALKDSNLSISQVVFQSKDNNSKYIKFQEILNKRSADLGSSIVPKLFGYKLNSKPINADNIDIDKTLNNLNANTQEYRNKGIDAIKAYPNK